MPSHTPPDFAQPKTNPQHPESRDNRFGGSLGGYIPKLPESARTYFYMNYEGRRLAATTQISRIVPTDTLKQGILRFRDAAGNIIPYNDFLLSIPVFDQHDGAIDAADDILHRAVGHRGVGSPAPRTGGLYIIVEGCCSHPDRVLPPDPTQPPRR